MGYNKSCNAGVQMYIASGSLIRIENMHTLITGTDCSPFGSPMSERSWSEGYRYGFNGKEKDDESFAGAYDFEERIFDNRIGRFLSIDPLSYMSCWSTPYSFAANKPILMIDVDGLKGTIYIQVMLNKDGTPVISKDDMAKVQRELSKVYSDLGVDLKIEVVYSNKVFTKDEFYKREGADATDSYVLIGNGSQLIKTDEDNRDGKNGWQYLSIKQSDGSARPANGTSATSQFFTMINSDNVSRIGVEPKEYFHSVVNKISCVIQHETGHPKFTQHPGMMERGQGETSEKYKGGPNHVPRTIMDAGTACGLYQCYDMFMAQELRKFHGMSDNAMVLAKDTKEVRDFAYSNYAKSHPNLTADQIKLEVDAITTWIKPTECNSLYKSDCEKKIPNERHK